jgi:hypothetical protein
VSVSSYFIYFSFVLSLFYSADGAHETTSPQSSSEPSAQPSAQPSPIFSANLAPGLPLLPTIIDLTRDDINEDRDPASIQEELRGTVEALFWGQRYRTCQAEEKAANMRGEHALTNYIIALEKIVKSRTKPGQRSSALPLDVKGKVEVSELSVEAFNRMGKGEACDRSEGTSDRKGKGKAREPPSEDEAPFDNMDDDESWP